jgi:hypothetical protein
LGVCGYSQIKGVDYNETFSPTTSVAVIFVLLSIGANQGMNISGFDVTAAFLEGKNDCVQYCRLPKELGGYRLQILGSLYGQKQSPKLWNDRFNNILLGMGFKRCPMDPCLYKLEKTIEGPNGLVILILLCIHVDDGLVVSNTKEADDWFMKELLKHIRKTTVFPKCEKFLGMEMEYEDHYVKLHQETYISSMGLERCKKEAHIPMSSTVRLRQAEPNEENESLLPYSGKYRYVADRTRPDILLAVGEISTGGSVSPSDDHVKTAHQIAGYLEDTKSERLFLGGCLALILMAFADAALIRDGNAKSRLAHAIFLAEDAGAIASVTRNETTTSHSSCEAEIKAEDLAIRSILYYRGVMEFVGHKQVEPTIIYNDNEASVAILETLKSTHNTRHINAMISFIRDCILDKTVKLEWIRTHLNVADMLTKALHRELFEYFRVRLLRGFGGKFNPNEEKE